MEERIYRVHGHWNGGLNGHGVTDNDRGTLHTEFSVPSTFGGPGGMTNPEEIFLSSACSCYLVTLALIADRMQIPVNHLSCEVEGHVIPDEQDGYHFREIVLYPHMEIDGDEAKHEETIARAIRLAEQRCIISRAVKGSVKYDIQHSVAAV